MTKRKTLTGILSAFAFLTLVSAVRADTVHPRMDFEKLIFAENQHITPILVEKSRCPIESPYKYL